MLKSMLAEHFNFIILSLNNALYYYLVYNPITGAGSRSMAQQPPTVYCSHKETKLKHENHKKK